MNKSERRLTEGIRATKSGLAQEKLQEEYRRRKELQVHGSVKNLLDDVTAKGVAVSAAAQEKIANILLGAKDSAGSAAGSARNLLQSMGSSAKGVLQGSGGSGRDVTALTSSKPGSRMVTPRETDLTSRKGMGMAAKSPRWNAGVDAVDEVDFTDIAAYDVKTLPETCPVEHDRLDSHRAGDPGVEPRDGAYAAGGEEEDYEPIDIPGLGWRKNLEGAGGNKEASGVGQKGRRRSSMFSNTSGSMSSKGRKGRRRSSLISNLSVGYNKSVKLLKKTASLMYGPGASSAMEFKEENEFKSSHILDTDQELLDRYVEINVGGIRYHTQIRILRKYAHSMLCDETYPGGALYDKGYMFLDRDPLAFNYILNYYRTDVMHTPDFLGADVWMQELQFYVISNPLNELPTSDQVHAEEVAQGKPAIQGWKQDLWLILENPSSSKLAAATSTVSIIFILIGVAAFICETHPDIRTLANKTYMGIGMKGWAAFFETFNVVCVAFFSLELLARFIATSMKIRFCFNFINLVDLVAVLPFYLEFIPGATSTTFLRVLRLARIIRVIGLVLKLSKYSAGARVLGTTIISSGSELYVMVVALIIDSILIGAAFFNCENSDLTVEESDFNSIYKSMYVAFITIMTVGYGDYSPTNVCGRAFAALAALSGVFVLGLPISIIGVKFHEEYQALTSKLEAQEETLRARAADEKLGANRGMWVLARKILGPNFKPGEDKLTPMMEKKIEIGVENIFALIDADGSGYLDRQELGQALSKLGVSLKIESLWRVFKELDTDGSGKIDIHEFHDFILRVVSGKVPSGQLLIADTVQGSGGRRAGGEGATVFH